MDQMDWQLAAQLNGLNNIMDIQQQQQLSQPQPLDYGNISNLAGQLNNLNLGNSGVGMTPPMSPMTPMSRLPGASIQDSPISPAPTGQRLFVVVHKGVSEEQLARCFRRFPGMEYCDLKRDRITGKSKGYAYVNYSTTEAAQAAIGQLNGMDFPQGSGQQLKVMLAEPLVPRTTPNAGPRWMEDAASFDMGMDSAQLYSDPRVVHFYLDRPLPDYALKNVFDEHCHVESVQLHVEDPRLGYAIALTSDDAQRLAVSMNGQNIVGVPITVYLNSAFDPSIIMHADQSAAPPLGPDMLTPSGMDFSSQIMQEGHIN
eukprot:TRINITY_DN5708_c1_g1_i12.p3 TRINITY_DN5708_c1_g1~~TRINITY_DN5708_c1_g1_i12.p3  ORF type:complete len:314 (-),score=54.90 TRINITY_DN5708_c1_g1_i12:3080-4021(-)